jgi:hypothetical protein
LRLRSSSRWIVNGRIVDSIEQSPSPSTESDRKHDARIL